MKKFFIISFLILFGITLGSAQSIEDLQKLEQLKKQLEKAGTTMQKSQAEKIPQVKNLEQFKEKLSQPPQIGSPKVKKADTIAVKVEKKAQPVKKSSLPIFGFDV